MTTVDWDFGDGSTEVGVPVDQTPLHTWFKGIYTVTASVDGIDYSTEVTVPTAIGRSGPGYLAWVWYDNPAGPFSSVGHGPASATQGGLLLKTGGLSNPTNPPPSDTLTGADIQTDYPSYALCDVRVTNLPGTPAWIDAPFTVQPATSHVVVGPTNQAFKDQLPDLVGQDLEIAFIGYEADGTTELWRSTGIFHIDP